MRRPVSSLGTLFLLVAVLAGCGGPKTAADQAGSRRGLQPAWEAAANPFVVPGWKSGDQASWQAQMTKRAQNQNEFVRLN